MSDWQGIETAPRDGTEFLAYDVLARKMDVCSYIDGVGIRPTQVDCEYGPFPDDFGYDEDGIQFWMPLPTHPR